ncbi:Hypothetical protein PHPALM_1858 [Phytophthora palmivora]|uniref:Uncharacterized protein n=1 Tax=Phytophthora palmivora TaxID=4796 RepID=A0A2P4YR82_9STRA|nr:Hypothetical protein PHPALM_1858 [Phytophthora palmivora]
MLQNRIHALKDRVEDKNMSASDNLKRLRQSQRTKVLLLKHIQDQRLMILHQKTAWARSQDTRLVNPLYTYIHLPKTGDKRRHLLTNLKDGKLSKAFQYVVARDRYLDLQSGHGDGSEFHDDHGTLCCDRFEVTQRDGVKSLKDAYDAAKFFVSNVEINTMEALGYTSKRKDYDVIGEDASTHNFHLISSSPSDITTESHKVMYTKYSENSELFGDCLCRVITTDNVDQDDLHPFQSESRIRLNVSSALVLTETRRVDPISPANKAFEGDDVSDGDRVVILQCALFLKIHDPRLDVPIHKLYAIGDGIAAWIGMMIQTIRELSS